MITFAQNKMANYGLLLGLFVSLVASETRVGVPLALLPHPTAAIDAQITASPTGIICGYENGVANETWQAEDGYNCAYDQNSGVFGFCLKNSDPAKCGTQLVGQCFDAGNCKDGCSGAGKKGAGKFSTLSCSAEKPNCWSALMTSQAKAYTYFGCDSVTHAAATFYATPTSPGFVPTADSSTAAPARDDNDDEGRAKPPLAALVGGSVGGVVLLSAMFFVTWYCLRKRQAAAEEGQPRMNFDSDFDDMRSLRSAPAKLAVVNASISDDSSMDKMSQAESTVSELDGTPHDVWRGNETHSVELSNAGTIHISLENEWEDTARWTSAPIPIDNEEKFSMPPGVVPAAWV